MYAIDGIMVCMRVSAVKKPRVMISLISLVKSAFALLELFIVTRIILDFLRASQDALFIQWLNAATDPLLRPFIGIFPPLTVSGGFILELHAIFALIVYAFIGYLITAGLNFLAIHKILLRDNQAGKGNRYG